MATQHAPAPGTAPTPTPTMSQLYAAHRGAAKHRYASWVSFAAHRMSLEIGAPDFDGWHDYIAAPADVLHQIAEEHASAEWCEHNRSEPHSDFVDEVIAAWRAEYPAQAAAFDAEVAARVAV